MKKKSKSKSKYAVGGPIGTPPVSSPPPMGQRPLRPDEMNALKNPMPSTPPPPPMYSGKMGQMGRLDPITDRLVMPSQPVMPQPQPRPSNFNIGGLQFGGVGGANMPGNMGNYSSPMNRPMLNDGRPMRKQRRMENMRQVVKDRLEGMPEKFDGMNKRMRPNAPAPVGPGGGYKKGGKIDGCATRGMTKGKNK